MFAAVKQYSIALKVNVKLLFVIVVTVFLQLESNERDH